MQTFLYKHNNTIQLLHISGPHWPIIVKVHICIRQSLNLIIISYM